MAAGRNISTDQRILDAAEQLFATEGIGGTSIRAIVRTADVNVAAIHYHFGSKAGVLAAVFKRARAPINRDRLEALAALRTDSARRRLPLDGVLRACYWPAFRRFAGATRDRAWRTLSIFAQLRLDPSDEAKALMERHESEFVDAFDEAFAESTGRPIAELRRRIQFVNAAAWDVLVQPMFLRELDAADNPQAVLEQLFDEFIQFAVGAIAQRNPPRKRKTKKSITKVRSQ